MTKYALLIIGLSSTLFSQELNDEWLNTTIEKSTPEIVEVYTARNIKSTSRTTKKYLLHHTSSS